MAVYRERIERAIAPLLQAGFRLVSMAERVEVFGNVVAVVSSNSIKFRLISDRGQLLADVSTDETKGWYSLRTVLTLGGVDAAVGPWDSADEAVRAFQTNEPLIARLLADKSSAAGLPSRP